MPVIEGDDIYDYDDDEENIEEEDISSSDDDDDDDSRHITMISISSDDEDEEEDEDEDCPSEHEINSFFDNLSNVLNENELKLFDKYAKAIVRCAADGIKQSVIADLAEVLLRGEPGNKQLTDIKIKFACSKHLQRKFVERDISKTETSNGELEINKP